MPLTGLPEGPNVITYSTAITYKRSDGSWKAIRRYYNSKDEVVKKDITFGVPGQGVFKVDRSNGSLEFISAMPPVEKTSYVTISDGHDQPNFVRDDSVNGYQAYVLRFPDDNGGYLEIYYCPELDNTSIQEVTVSPLGVEIEQMVKVKLGDPDDKVFEGAPKWLVNYEFFKQKIATMDQAGKHEAADAMRKELAEQIAKQGRAR